MRSKFCNTTLTTGASLFRAIKYGDAKCLRIPPTPCLAKCLSSRPQPVSRILAGLSLADTAGIRHSDGAAQPCAHLSFTLLLECSSIDMESCGSGNAAGQRLDAESCAGRLVFRV